MLSSVSVHGDSDRTRVVPRKLNRSNASQSNNVLPNGIPKGQSRVFMPGSRVRLQWFRLCRLNGPNSSSAGQQTILSIIWPQSTAFSGLPAALGPVCRLPE
jgi:hypothetical protein